MKGRRGNLQNGLTRIEVLVIIAVLAFLVALLLPALYSPIGHAPNTECINNLKQIGLGFRMWAKDHDSKFPMGISTNDGGTEEYVTMDQTFRHFQVMSNELRTTRLLACPSDVRRPAKNFEPLRNTNISYFIGLDASDIYPATFLAGDRNLTNGTLLPNGILALTSNSIVGWTGEMHNGQGHVLIADGSVQSFSNPLLRWELDYTGIITNHLALPLD